MHKAQKLINHVALVLDGSSSMTAHQSKLVQVADDQIRHLALRSEELSQETRVSVYLFADRVECLIFDMDVMRLPSIADLYKANGMTALIDSVVKSQSDLSTTSQIYGDHAFLTFVLTDGMENKSQYGIHDLSMLLNDTKSNRTIGFLVPDERSVTYLTRLGADRGSIAVWNTNDVNGILDAASTIRNATDDFMTARATGVRGTRTVFSTGRDAVNKQTVSSSLQKLNSYKIFSVANNSRIDDFVRSLGLSYVKGTAYYELTKSEKIQPQKEIIVVNKKTKEAWGGNNARDLIGLPRDREVRVRPENNPEFSIFVQSTSLNRNLVPGTSVVLHY